MSDDRGPTAAPHDPIIAAPAGQPWPGPLGNPHLTSVQRQYLAEDRVLAIDAQLDPDDDSLQARQVRATAADIREHRELAHRQPTSPAGDRMPVPPGLVGVARREWVRRIDLPTAERAAHLAETIWQHGYPAVFGSVYTAAAFQIAAAATNALIANPHARATLQPLVEAASDAVARYAPGQPSPPLPTDDRTVAAVQDAAAHPGRAAPPHWRHLLDAAWTGTRNAATLAGAMTATTDVLVGWRARGGHRHVVGVRIGGRTARAWVNDLIATAGRDAVAPLTAPGGQPAAAGRSVVAGAGNPPAAGSAAPSARPLTAAQLARQDQPPPEGSPAPTRQRPDTRPRQRHSITNSTRHGRSR